MPKCALGPVWGKSAIIYANPVLSGHLAHLLMMCVCFAELTGITLGLANFTKMKKVKDSVKIVRRMRLADFLAPIILYAIRVIWLMMTAMVAMRYHAPQSAASHHIRKAASAQNAQLIRSAMVLL
jgi:hypothetical protein